MTSRFFVYGSLSEGMVHWAKISPYLIQSVPGTIRGSVYRLPVGYPVLLKEGDCLVSGQIVEIKSSEILLGLLDEFHGFNPFDSGKSLSFREETTVWPEGLDLPARVWVYYLNPEKLPQGAKPIRDGDWRRSLQEQGPLTERLTDRQKAYLLKLGAASGRDIVPINDLSLYRELMNLELIVDKGRRLALSKLGQEVYRHLG